MNVWLYWLDVIYNYDSFSLKSVLLTLLFYGMCDYFDFIGHFEFLFLSFFFIFFILRFKSWFHLWNWNYYHKKFQCHSQSYSTCECIFSLNNGTISQSPLFIVIFCCFIFFYSRMIATTHFDWIFYQKYFAEQLYHCYFSIFVTWTI